MNTKYFEKYSKRINRFNILLAIISIFIIACFFNLQILPHPELSNQIKKDGFRHKTIIGSRGKIIDRNNEELAITINKYDFWINTNKKVDRELIAALFSQVFDRTKNDYLKILEKKSKYTVIEKNVPDDKAYFIIEEINNIPGLNYEKKSSRFYKYKQFASHVIGYTDNNGIGRLGIEQRVNSLLNGDTISISLKKGAKGKFFNQEIINDTAIEGHNIKLTIDIELQKILQEELNKAVSLTNAQGANGIIVNPHNGEILAIASIPDFNPNQYNEYPLNNFSNSVISDSYEPGSTFKILPIALILNDQKYSLNDSIYCENGSYKLSNNKLMHDHEENQFLTIKDILVHSSNIGISKLSESYNRENLYKLIRRFGFGSKTNIPLNNEATGKIREISNWSKTSKNYISIGQELSITNLQLAMAYSVIANGGILINPSLIKEINKNDTVLYLNEEKMIRRVLNHNVSFEILNMLKDVVDHGTAQSINLDNYSIAGKTGTAQKFKDGHLNNYVATFASIFPADKPKFVMIVSIDEPAYGKHWANLSAVPSSSEIIKRMLIKYDKIHEIIAKKSASKKEIISSKYELSILSNYSKIDKKSFPDFRGKTLKEALKIAQLMNIILIPKGISGKITNQSINPGSELKNEMICQVQIKI